MRVTTTKSKNSESFYVVHSYTNENGKCTSKVFRKLGTLKELSKKLNTDRDGVMAWAKEQARLDTEEYNKGNKLVPIELNPNVIIDKDVKRSFNCGYLFLQAICKDLRFDNICRNIKGRYNFKYNIHSILKHLIYTRILSPSSKRSSYDYAQTLLEPPKYELHDVYRALSVLAKESDYIQEEIYRNSNFIHKRDSSVLYYDCTNYYFEIEQEEDDKKYGKSKEHRPNPIIGMGLFMDGDGIPLSFSTFPGNQNEQKTLKPLEKKIINDFGCSDFIYCSDSGLASKENKLFNSIQGRKYVITQSLKKLKKEDRTIALNKKQFRKVGSERFIDLSTLDESDETVFNSVYYKEIPVIIGKTEEILLVTYSPKYARYQKNIRSKQIERAQSMISKGGKLKSKRNNPNDPARFIQSTHTTENGEVSSETYYSLNQNAISEEAMYDGYYAVTTNIDGDIKDIIAINKRRWQIEECFRIIKTDFEARPVYLQLKDRIEAHFLICYLALVVYRLLEIKLNHRYTIKETLDTLRKMQLYDLGPHGYIPIYQRTDITDALHEVFDFRTDFEIIKNSKMKNIIKMSKN